METVGFVMPETEAEAHELHEYLAAPAREVVREVALAIGLDAEEYTERVTEAVHATGRDALFGSLLVVTTGEREAFERWRERGPYGHFDLHVEGSEHVDHVAWHAAPCVDRMVAATYQDEREAAVATLRRIAWGRVYRPLLAPTD